MIMLNLKVNFNNYKRDEGRQDGQQNQEEGGGEDF